MMINEQHKIKTTKKLPNPFVKTSTDGAYIFCFVEFIRDEITHGRTTAESNPPDEQKIKRHVAE